MATAITIPGTDGTITMNDDGEIRFSPSDQPRTEVLTAEQAISRWPSGAAQIRQALRSLKPAG